MSENRQHERHDVSISVDVVIDDRTYSGESHDVSIGGMRVELPDDAPMLRSGMRLEVSFRLPQLEHAVSVPAMVRWTDRLNDRIGGVQFLRGLRAVEVWAIDRMRRAG